MTMRLCRKLSRGGGVNWLPRLLIIILTTLHEVLLVPTSPTSLENRSTDNVKITIPRAVAAARKFPCREPQPRAYHIRDLVHSMRLLDSHESAHQPIYIIVKRCDGHSGCCSNPDMTCVPVSGQIYFDDVEIEVWSVKTNQSKRQWFTVEQHGLCSCKLTDYDDRVKLDYQKPTVIPLRKTSSQLR